MSPKRRASLPWWRSGVSVLAGYVSILAFTWLMFLVFVLLAPDAFHMEEQRVDAPWSTVIVVLGVVAAIQGGYMTAFLARGSELPHTLALMGWLLGMWILFVVTAPPEQSSLYQSGIQLAGVLGALAGGVLRAAQVSRRGAIA